MRADIIRVMLYLCGIGIELVVVFGGNAAVCGDADRGRSFARESFAFKRVFFFGNWFLCWWDDADVFGAGNFVDVRRVTG